MTRYIDADALKLDVDLSKGATIIDMALSVIRAVQEAPTADVVEVVRCKDCVHFTAGYCCRDVKGRSQMHYMGEDAFCSYGERTPQKEGVSK